MTTPIPLKIQRQEHGVLIRWSDQHEQSITCEVLRRNCPCAECREARGDTSHAAPLSPAPKKSLLKVIEHTRDEELRLEKIWPVGNYALGLSWGDSHDSGIYTFQLLRELGG